MTLAEVLTGIGAVITAAGGVILVVRELHRRERRVADQQIDNLTEQVQTLRADFLVYHLWAYDLAQRMVDAGLEVPVAPTPHALAEPEEEEKPRRRHRREKGESP